MTRRKARSAIYVIILITDLRASELVLLVNFFPGTALWDRLKYLLYARNDF